MAKLAIIKEREHNFSVGFNLIKKVGLFQLVYSFATRSHNQDIKKYYLNNIDVLFQMGDYGYKLISGTYAKYSNLLPIMNSPAKTYKNQKLRLIINDPL